MSARRTVGRRARCRNFGRKARGGEGTKPYLSASHSLLKISEFRRGEWCETWDALLWSFIADHEGVFRANPRLQPLILGPERRQGRLDQDRRRAEAFWENLQSGDEEAAVEPHLG